MSLSADDAARFGPSVEFPEGAIEEWLSTILEVVPDAMIVVDAGGTILTANSQAHALFGYEIPELVGATVESLIPARARSRHEQLRSQFHASPVRRSLGTELPLAGRRRDGTEFPVDISLGPIRAGRLVHVLCAIRDMSARELAEKSRLRLIEEHSARERAEAAVRERDEFLSAANHELRTPITALKAASQLALRRLRAGQLEGRTELEGLLNLMDEQTSKATRLINDLLDGSRLVVQHLRLERRPVDLGAVVRSAMESTRLLSAGSHVLHFQADAPVVVDVDPIRIEQVVTNLLDNALKFSPPGSTIEVNLTEEEHEARVTVRDHGIGVSPEYRERIFDRFFQAPTSSHPAGMGLGLFISRELVQLHGGRLEVEFPEDGGTRFVLRIPRHAAPQGASPGVVS